ncbi:MAG: lipocalin family protein [Flavobacteriales bacterium]
MIQKMMQGILGAGLMGLFGCAAQPPLETVQYVDLQKYAGKWYEIASFPTRFQAGCQATTATYTLSPEGHVVVENRCRRDSLNGELSYIKGKAWVEPNSGNAKLKVQFFWPFRGKYWILELDPEYRYAAVGHPNREYLWILCREPKMEAAIFQEICRNLKAKGFDINRLVLTPQQ